MVIEAIIGAVLGFVEALLGFLPDAGDLGLDGFGALIGTLQSLNVVLPVTELIAVTLAMLAIRLILVLYGLAKELWEWIPFV